MIDPALLDALRERGFACGPAPGLLARAERDPWAVARLLHREGPVWMVESHPIHPIPGGHSYAANHAETPLHTDSQSYRGLPPKLQVMLCERPAASGGQTVLIDTWPLLEQIAAADPELFAALLTRPRRIPFVFGDVIGPTVALRGDALVFTHSPMPPHDELGRRLAPWIAAAPRIELRVAADELLLVDNHRMLHGRQAFEDPQRRFLRLLVWAPAPTRAPAWLLQRASASRERLARATKRLAPDLRERVLGLVTPHDDRLTIITELLRGTSPGVLARRHGIPEPELYRWRDAALRGATDALAELDSPAAHEAALEQTRQQLERKLR
jgi:gamma-butyrobetaine dioxygenase